METLNKQKKYKVHPDDPDVRGWTVIIEDTRLGAVDDLVLDKNSMTVQYLDLIREDHTERKNFHYLIPLDQVHFKMEEQQVRVETDPDHFITAYPRYSGEIPHDYDERVRNYYSEGTIRKKSGKARRHEDKRVYEDDKIYADKTEERFQELKTEGEERKESPFGTEYERLKRNPENLKEKISVLEKHKHRKQLKMIEMERDIALINEEITKQIARLK